MSTENPDRILRDWFDENYLSDYAFKPKLVAECEHAVESSDGVVSDICPLIYDLLGMINERDAAFTKIKSGRQLVLKCDAQYLDGGKVQQFFTRVGQISVIIEYRNRSEGFEEAAVIATNYGVEATGTEDALSANNFKSALRQTIEIVPMRSVREMLTLIRKTSNINATTVRAQRGYYVDDQLKLVRDSEGMDHPIFLNTPIIPPTALGENISFRLKPVNRFGNVSSELIDKITERIRGHSILLQGPFSPNDFIESFSDMNMQVFYERFTEQASPRLKELYPHWWAPDQRWFDEQLTHNVKRIVDKYIDGVNPEIETSDPMSIPNVPMSNRSVNLENMIVSSDIDKRTKEFMKADMKLKAIIEETKSTEELVPGVDIQRDIATISEIAGEGVKEISESIQEVVKEQPEVVKSQAELEYEAIERQVAEEMSKLDGGFDLSDFFLPDIDIDTSLGDLGINDSEGMKELVEEVAGEGATFEDALSKETDFTDLVGRFDPSRVPDLSEDMIALTSDILAFIGGPVDKGIVESTSFVEQHKEELQMYERDLEIDQEDQLRGSSPIRGGDMVRGQLTRIKSKSMERLSPIHQLILDPDNKSRLMVAVGVSNSNILNYAKNIANDYGILGFYVLYLMLQIKIGKPSSLLAGTIQTFTQKQLRTELYLLEEFLHIKRFSGPNLNRSTLRSVFQECIRTCNILVDITVDELKPLLEQMALCMIVITKRQDFLGIGLQKSIFTTSELLRILRSDDGGSAFEEFINDQATLARQVIEIDGSQGYYPDYKTARYVQTSAGQLINIDKLSKMTQTDRFREAFGRFRKQY